MRTFAAALLIALLLLTAAIYWPGLAGGFLFDDYANLPALGRYGGVHDWQTFTWYMTSGVADPTGRPVSMLSFLLDARDWPADPAPFKRTNLLLHLCNGLLLYSILAALGRRVASSPAHARSAALLGTALWLLHPLWVSTVLYVIQRHAMLATFFVLAGVRAWIASRDAFAQDKTRRGWIWAIFAVPVFGLLAGLSKANGFLLPLMILALQATVLTGTFSTGNPGHPVRNGRLATWLFICIPAALVMLALASEGFRNAAATTSFREWDLGQRLLTQPRALFDYLRHLFLPGLDARGVFADDFPVSSDIWHPWTTLPSIIGVTGLLLLGISSRRRWPSLAAALLFFLAGHAMESTVIPLELYFEHRNYLPATLLFWPLALWLCRPGARIRWSRPTAAAIVALLSLLTLAQAQLWSDPAALARDWSSARPRSARAQAYAASIDLQAGHIDAAIRRLEPLAATSPDEPQLALNLLHARCRTGHVPESDLARAETSLRTHGVGMDMPYQWLANLLSIARDHPCAGLPEASLQRLFAAAIAHGANSREEQARIAHLHGLDALRNKDCDLATKHLDQRLRLMHRPEFAQSQTGLLATHCGADYGLRHLDRYLRDAAEQTPAASPALRLRDWLMARDGYWEREWERLRTVLLQDRAAG